MSQLLAPRRKGQWRDERDGPRPVSRGGLGKCYADCDGCRARAQHPDTTCDACSDPFAANECIFAVVSPGEHQLMCSVCATGGHHPMVDVALVRDGRTFLGACPLYCTDHEHAHTVACYEHPVERRAVTPDAV